MKHKLKFIALITLLSISLTGCYPTGEKPLPSNTDSVEHFSGKITEKVGNIEMNYDISADFPTKLPKIRLKAKELDKEQCKSVLLRGKEIAPPSNDVPSYVTYTTDGSKLVLTNGSFSFFDNCTAPSLEYLGEYSVILDKDSYKSDDQFDSISPAEAIEQANKVLDELGIENYTEPYVIPITADLVKEFVDTRGEGNVQFPLWKEGDGFYLLKYRFKYNGIELSNEDLKTPGQSRSVHGSEINVRVSKNGVFAIDTTRLYEVVSLDEGNVDMIYDAKYASDQFIEHFSKVTGVEHRITFTHCQPEYIPLEWINSDEAVFTPAWCFSGNEYYDDFLSYDVVFHYYADTGRQYGGY